MAAKQKKKKTKSLLERALALAIGKKSKRKPADTSGNANQRKQLDALKKEGR